MKNETNTCFNELFPDFIRKMEQTNTDILDPSITDAVTDICRAMGISYFHATIEISPELNKGVSVTRQTTYFSEGEYDENLSYSIKKHTPSGIANYNVYQHKGAAPWTAEEINNIDIFLTTFFIFNGRARAMSLCDDLMYHDVDLGVYNLKFLL